VVAALEPGRIVASRYRVESQLGEGGMGSVYLVKHVHTDESLAMKVLHAQVLRDESAVERFRREARAPARIASEHVARVTDADTAPDLDNAPFYVMELLRGRDLERIVKEEGPLAPGLVVEYLRQASRALDKAHAMGIIHRDLKPENLFLTEREDGTPCIKLLDFGIARLADKDQATQMRTQAGYIFGTPMYMSPEQTLGDVDAISPSTDVWAIGLCAFKLLVGAEFWVAETTAQLCVHILSAPIPTPSARGSTFGPSFDAWFARCVNREQSERFKTVGEAVAALAEALGVRMARASIVSSAHLPTAATVPAFAAQTSASGSIPEIAAATPIAPPVQLPRPQSTPSYPQELAPKPSRTGLVIGIVAVAGVFGLVVAGGAYFYAVRSKPVPSVGIVSSATSASPSSPSAVASVAPPPSADPTSTVAAVESAPRPPVPKIARGGGGAGAAAEPKPAATKEAPASPTPVLSRDQRRRLEALQRLCDQGTFTAAECAAKRAAIQREGN
jgi:serine/threonine-protein kinase